MNKIYKIFNWLVKQFFVKMEDLENSKWKITKKCTWMKVLSNRNRENSFEKLEKKIINSF